MFHITGATFRDHFNTGPKVVTYYAELAGVAWHRYYVWTLDTWGGIDAAVRLFLGEQHTPGIYIMRRLDCPAIGRMVTVDD